MIRTWRLTIVTLAAAAAGSLARGQTTERVSVDSGGAQGFGQSYHSSLSANGRFVAFHSYSSNLVAGDTNNFNDIFVRDRQSGTIERVSIGPGGLQANADSWDPSISADGRFVAFYSNASNLIPGGGTNWFGDIFVHDRQSGTTERVSVDSSGTQANALSEHPSISGDGRYVAFESTATNLVANDTNGFRDIFVHDRLSGTTERVSVDTNGVQVDGVSADPSISADGSLVAFWSYAPNLVAGDTNGLPDVFVHDRRQNGKTDRASIDSDGAQGNGLSFKPSISADGRFVAFYSTATNLVVGDANGMQDVFVHDRLIGTTERVSVASDGTEANGDSYEASISADARFVAFRCIASNFVSSDTNQRFDVFVHDRLSGRTESISVDPAGGQGNDTSYLPSISADGRLVAFDSNATNLVAGDTNGSRDVFVRDRGPGLPGFDRCQPGHGGVIACPCSNPPANAPRGCDNSAATGGAQLTSSGLASLAFDSLVFVTNGEKPSATSIVLQGTAEVTNGVAFGQGVRCVGGGLKRLYTKTASGGSITAPGTGDLSVSARSAALGDPITAGTNRWYAVYYRDPVVLGGCPAASTFNVTQTQLVPWGA